MQLEKEISKNSGFKNLCKALAELKSEKDIQKLLRDVCTFNELTEISGRMEAAQLIKEGISYRSIAKKTGVSTATITRVAYWINCGMGGYNLALNHHHNTPEALKGKD